MNRYADRIRRFREMAGKSDVEMASLLGMTIDSYCDLEAYDDEILTVPSLDQVKRLSNIFGMPTSRLFSENNEHINRHWNYEMLIDKVNDHLRSNHLSQENFEDLIGWDMSNFFESEEKCTTSFNVEFIQVLCAKIGENWLEYLP